MPGPRVAVLGPVRVEAPDGDLHDVAGALARSLVVALVLARGHQLATESLIDALWADEPPRGARAALQTLVSRLRRTTAAGLVLSTGTGYALGVGPSDVDLAVAERADADDVAATRAALELWRGEPGADLEGVLAEGLAGRAAAARRVLRRRLGDHLSSSGDAPAAARLWLEECAANPFDEVAVGGAMRTLTAAGRTAEALALFAAHRDRLVDELGADPAADLVRLNADLLRRTGPVAGTVRRIGLRASPTALVGREADVAAVSGLLSAGRLVTVLGAGGLGKTRLAQAVAAAVPADQAVVVVELAPLAAGEDIVPSLGALLGIAEVRAGRSLHAQVVADLRGRVLDVLGERPTVLVLDNCEHLVADAAVFAGELLADLPSLRILTTSRAALAIAGEVVAPLAPLPVEDDGAAVRLFTERARAARPGAALPLDAVRRICTRLDGSPLAIELAAARIRGMSIDEIERRLDDRFALLRGGDRSAPERHRTLLAVIEWSWRLLDDGARSLLTRMALFPDGLGVDAVEAVAEPARASDALDDLAELVEQSLVQLVEHEGEPVRYRLLETVREFGAARLTDADATADVRAAMTRWGTAFASPRNVFLAGGRQDEVFAEVRREVDTLVTLLRWALVDDDAPAVAAVFSALGTHWSLRGAHGETVALAVDVIAVLRAVPDDGAARRDAVTSLVVAGASAALFDRRTLVRALSVIRRCMRAGGTGDALLDAQASLLLVLGRAAEGAALLARYREHPDQRVAAFALTLSAPMAENDGDGAVALRHARRAQELSTAVVDSWTTATAAVSLAQLLSKAGRPVEALAAAGVARARLEQFGAEDDLAELDWTVGLASAGTGAVDRAREIAAVMAGRPMPEHSGPDGDRAQAAVLALAIRAEVARAEGDPQTAADRYAEAARFVLEHRREARNWFPVVATAAIAARAEAAAGRLVGAEPRLPSGPTDRATSARRLRVATLVLLRLRPIWLDLPVVATGILGLTVGLVDGDGDAALIGRGWGLSVRLCARQDFGVLRHDRLRPLVVASIGERAAADAETASAGWDRDQAAGAARALLEELQGRV